MPLLIASSTRCQPTTGPRPRARRRTAIARQPRPSARRVRPQAREPGVAPTRQRPRLRRARRRAPPAASSSSAVPCSTTTPSASTTARSATPIVDSRWVATSTVRPATAGRRFSTSRRSVSRVDRGHRVVEHEHARAGEERAGERDALPLAAGEVDAALADQRVVALGRSSTNAETPAALAGREHLLPGRVRAAPRAGCRAGAPRTARASASRSRRRSRSSATGTSRVSTPPTSTRPRGRVVEARQQVEQRRLAGAGRPADGDDLARLDVEVDPAQHLGSAAVGEADVLEARRAAGRPAGAVGSVGSGSGRIPSSHAKLRPAEATARWPRLMIQPSASSGQTSCSSRRDEEHELADRQRARDHVAAAEEQHRGDAERRQEEQAGEVVRLDASPAASSRAAPPRPGRGSACARPPRGRTPAPSRCRRPPRRSPRSGGPSSPGRAGRSGRAGARRPT